MKTITMPLGKLNILDFLNDSLENGKQFINIPIILVDQKEKFDLEDEEFEKYEEIDAQALYKEFLEGKYMFVTFSDCGVNYPEVACIDGNEYFTLDEMDVEEYFEDEEVPEGFVFTENILLGEDSNLGYLLQYNDGQVSIQSAQFFLDATGGAGPCWTRSLTAYSSIEPIENVEVFEEPMKNYLNRFINK